MSIIDDINDQRKEDEACTLWKRVMFLLCIGSAALLTAIGFWLLG